MRKLLLLILLLPTIGAAAGTPTQISFNTNNNQFAPAGSTLPMNPSVIVTDGGGAPVQGVSVTFAVASGGGSITGPSPATTDVNGIAAPASWTLGPAPGKNTLTATSGILITAMPLNPLLSRKCSMANKCAAASSRSPFSLRF